MIRKTLTLLGFVAVTLFTLAAPAWSWIADAGCTTVRLEAGGTDLGKTRLVYADGHQKDLDIDVQVFKVDNQGRHGHIIRVVFSNGESVELAAPVGCTATTTATSTVPEATPTTPSTAAPADTTTTTTTVSVVSPVEELPRTGGGVWPPTIFAGALLLAGGVMASRRRRGLT